MVCQTDQKKKHNFGIVNFDDMMCVMSAHVHYQYILKVINTFCHDMLRKSGTKCSIFTNVLYNVTIIIKIYILYDERTNRTLLQHQKQ